MSLINTLLIIDPNFASVPNTVWASDSNLPYSLCLQALSDCSPTRRISEKRQLKVLFRLLLKAMACLVKGCLFQM